mgnify:CR=1 FL=1|jgi:hypothetical protein
MKIGDKVLVPRTDGSYSPGEVIEVYTTRARVAFKLGDTYRGKPVPRFMQDQVAYKTIDQDKLSLLRDSAYYEVGIIEYSVRRKVG